MTFFNDLLILRLIVPHLQKETLRGLLRELKNIEKSLTPSLSVTFSLDKILELLSQSSGDVSLLKDFLQGSRYSGPV